MAFALVGISDGKIAAIAANLQPENATATIDATNLLLLPGGIDVHTHLDMPFGGTTSADDFQTGTIAAALLLTLAVTSHHFTAMGALEITPDPLSRFTTPGLSPTTLALVVAGAAIAVLGLVLGTLNFGAPADAATSYYGMTQSNNGNGDGGGGGSQ